MGEISTHEKILEFTSYIYAGYLKHVILEHGMYNRKCSLFCRA